MSHLENVDATTAFPQVEELDVKSVKPIPHMVVIPISAHIQDMCDRLEAGGDVGHVVAARVGSETYAIDNLEVLFAYREAGKQTVPCHVTPFISTDEALLAHVFASISFPVNPFLYGAAVDVLSVSLGEERLTGIEPKYMEIFRLPLVEEIRVRMTEYITELGKRHRHIPSFYHIFKIVARVERSVQVAVMDYILKYCDRLTDLTGVYSVTDQSNTESLISHFRNAKIKEEEPEEEEESGDVVVKVNDDEPGYYHEPDSIYMDFRCKCGHEYVVNTKNPSVREREDKKDIVVLSGEYGSPMYPIRHDAVDYLNLDTKPTVHYYMPFGGDSGRVVFLSTRPMPKQVLEKIKRVIEAHEKRAVVPRQEIDGR